MSLDQYSTKPKGAEQSEIRLTGNLVMQPREDPFKMNKGMKNVRAPSY